MTAWMIEGNGLKLMREFYANYNIINFVGGNTGAQMGGWFRKEIKSLADVKGAKFRIGGFGGKVFERIGGVPQNIPAARSTRRWKRAPSTRPSGSAPTTTRSSASTRWRRTTPTRAGGKAARSSTSSSTTRPTTSSQRRIQGHPRGGAASYAATDMQAKYDARNPAALKRLVGGGAKLFRFPKDMMDAAFKEAMALYSELNDSNPAWKKIYADYATFRRDENLWFRFTEAGFDDFMQQQQL